MPVNCVCPNYYGLPGAAKAKAVPNEATINRIVAVHFIIIVDRSTSDELFQDELANGESNPGGAKADIMITQAVVADLYRIRLA